MDSSGTHGLVAPATDNNGGTPVPWRGANTASTFTTNATGNGIGAGQMNTSLIVSEYSTYVALNPSIVVFNSAAKVCINYAIQANGTTACASPGTAGATCYADWYLPSAFELNQMYLRRPVIGGFASAAYWSSTEVSAPNAVQQSFVDGGGGAQSSVAKSASGNVRCIRAF